ncbi:MAG: MarR family transcriptional regulator [Acidimicrobiales bacterium]|jgi:DNA-binding MarR family transcriptional regulator|nr:MarR family transcriptional regulator [Acidimicrobiales bacterium]
MALAVPGDASTDASPALDLPENGLLGAIVRLNLAVTEVLESAAASAGLSFADYLVLGVVRRSPDGRSAPTTIARVLGRTTGGMTLTLDRLEAAGLLRRSRSTQDGRRVVVELTAAGRRVALRVNTVLHGWEDRLSLPMPVVDAVAVLDELTSAVRAH